MELFLLARDDDEQDNKKRPQEGLEVAMANLQDRIGTTWAHGTVTSKDTVKAKAQVPDEADRCQNEVVERYPRKLFCIHRWRREGMMMKEPVAYVTLCILHTDRRPNKNFK